MTESKFDRIFDKATPPAAEPASPPAAEVEKRPIRQRTPTAAAARPLGRPPGKRSDPAWKQFSVLLKRDTQREAAAILKAKDVGQDLSGLVQSLLERWIKQQRT